MVVVFLIPALFATFATANTPDCVYNRSQQHFHNSSYHYQPCGNTSGRGHIRDLECPDSSTIHICCNTPYQEEIQKSRQVWFRFIIAMCNAVSLRCTTRVLCEQSCKDGLSGLSNLGRSSYPEVLHGDSQDIRENVDAYNKGEALATCGEQQSRESKYYGRSRRRQRGESTCEPYCQQLYPECEQDIRHNFMSKLFYASARIFHLVGMSQFNADWKFRTQQRQSWTNHVLVGSAIKKAFKLGLIRMSQVSSDLEDWNEDNMHPRRRHQINRRRRSRTTDKRYLR